MIEYDKYFVWLKLGWDRTIICNDLGQYYFNSKEEAIIHKNSIIDYGKKYATENNYPLSKVLNLQFEINIFST